jgi:hypothetical protein
VDPGAVLDRFGKSRLTGIRSTDLPARSESLYRLSYPGSHIIIYESKMVALKDLEGSKMFRSLIQIIFRELVRSQLKSLIKTVKGQFWRCGSISWGV